MKIEDLMESGAIPVLKPQSNADRLNSIKDSAEMASSIIINGGKAIYTILLLLGFLFLIAYVTKEGAPMPSPDVSLALFLAVFAAYGLAVAAVCGIALTIPIYVRATIGKDSSAVFCYLFQRTPNHLARAIGQYLIVFSPFLILSGMFVRWVFWYGPEVSFWTPELTAMLIGDLTVLFLWSLVETDDRLWSSIKGIFVLNFAAIMWLLILWLTFFKAMAEIYGASTQISDIAHVIRFFVVAYIIMHFSFNVRELQRREWKWPIVFTIVGLMFFEPGASFFGGLALRLLGYGGRIPAYIVGRASNGSILYEGPACIILRTGKETMYTEGTEGCMISFSSPEDIQANTQRLRVDVAGAADIYPVGKRGLPAPATPPGGSHQ